MNALLIKLSNMTFDQAENWIRRIFKPMMPEGTSNALV